MNNFFLDEVPSRTDSRTFEETETSSLRRLKCYHEGTPSEDHQSRQSSQSQRAVIHVLSCPSSYREVRDIGPRPCRMNAGLYHRDYL